MIYYGPHGEMSVQIAPDVKRTRAGAVMTPEEAKIALTDYIAYFGTYTIDEKAGTVTHHRLDSMQPGDSGDLVRRYEFTGNRLVLRPPNSTMEVIWERIVSEPDVLGNVTMDILMPQLGETVAEGKITKWFKSAGDAVKPGDNLFEIETDKVSMEVPATTTGVLSEIRVSAGEVAPVGAVVGVIGGRRGRGGDARRPAAAAPKSAGGRTGRAAPPRTRLATAGALNRSSRSSSIRSSRSARPTAISARRSLPAALPSRRWRGGSPAKPASICRACAAPARTAASSPAMSKSAPRPRARPAALGRPERRRDQGALCAGQLRGSAARRHAQDHRGAADAGRRRSRISI